MIVYLIGKSPFEFRSVETYLDLSEQQSRSGIDVRVVFLHGSVMAARRNNHFEERMRRLSEAGAKLFLRTEDLEARSISGDSISDFGTPVNTSEIMKMAAESDTLVSVI